MKLINGAAFQKFRQNFNPKLKKLFLSPSNSFDNVKGRFPIGFYIWDCQTQDDFKGIKADVFDYEGNSLEKKRIYPVGTDKYINTWISLAKPEKDSSLLRIGFMDGINGNDVQHNTIVYIVNSKGQLPNPRGLWVNQENLLQVSVYLAVRRLIQSTWLNISDQFLYPIKRWQDDKVFITDCLTYTLFHDSSRITSRMGTNHWIPFTEKEVNAKDAFDSHFMTKFIAGKLGNRTNDPYVPKTKLVFSKEAKAVFDAGRKLWTYYHQQREAEPNASFYDIREFFQGRDEKGRMINRSSDETYNQLIADLRRKVERLGEKIRPKIYEYGFLKE